MAGRYFKKYIGVEIINNRKVKLDKKIVIYQRDRGLIMCFEIEGYDYVMVDRDGEHGEDMSGSYASVTLVNPDGREFFYDNIKVEGNTVEFMITEDMTDDLDEIGIYTLQIHINNELSPGDYSVFSVPPFNFEVLPRLGGSVEDIYLADSEGFELVDINGDDILVLN